MIVARKIDDRSVHLKLTFLNEEFLLQDGFVKCNTSIQLPPISYPSSITSKDKSESKQSQINHRHPKNNPTVFRIFDAISKGNCDEVNFSMQYVLFRDSYYNNQTAAIASLFCENPQKRKQMIKTLMNWKFDFKIPDLTFQRDTLHWCSILGYKKEFELIVDHLNCDVDYHSKDVDGNTYLHLAVMSNSLDLVKIILNIMMANDISVDVSNSLGFMPYILSRKLGYRDISNYIQSTNVASLNVFDNMLYKSPREWSILGQNARLKNHKKLKVNDKNNLKTFKIPEIVNESATEQKSIDINKIIHSAYIIWTNQHVDSFRKLARNRERIVIKSKFSVPLPTVHKKSRVK